MSKHHFNTEEFLVIDLEATCWEGGDPEAETNEILEFGWAILNTKTGEINKKGSISVRPTVSKVSPFCTSINGWTQEEADKGMTLTEACHMLENIGSKKMAWGSYGNYDIRMVKQQCEREVVAYPFTPHHMNIKVMANLIKNRGTSLSLGPALKAFGLKFEGIQHRGGDDAYNIARLMREIVRLTRRCEPACEHDFEEES